MFQAQGDRGRLMASYAAAATLGAWNLSTGETIGRVSQIQADVHWQHELLLRQRPLTIRLSLGAFEWCWELSELHLSDGRLQARALGAPVVIPAAKE